MDGENFMENPMNKWMIWGVKTHYFRVSIHIICHLQWTFSILGLLESAASACVLFFDKYLINSSPSVIKINTWNKIRKCTNAQCTEHTQTHLVQSSNCLWFQPIWKICSSNWILSPGISGWKFQKIFELPPPSLVVGWKIFANFPPAPRRPLWQRSAGLIWVVVGMVQQEPEVFQAVGNAKDARYWWLPMLRWYVFDAESISKCCT